MELNFKTFGHGPALIILHGLFGSLDNWVSHARRLAQHFSVYIVDQRNHGKSPHDEQWDYGLMADDLRDFMDQHSLYTAHLLGHSMGGKTVMQFAADFPERILRLVVADMAPKAYEPHHTRILEALNGLDLHTLESRQQADELLTPEIPQASVRQFLLKSLGRKGKNGYAWKFNLPVIYRDYWKVLANVNLMEPFSGPTLFVHGGKSDYLLEEDYEAIEAHFPAATFACIPEAGHWLHADAPEAFLRIVENFLVDESL